MPCFHPLHALEVPGQKTVAGKPVYHILKYLDPLYDDSRCLKLPCGKCVGCRLEYSRQWANRCMLELQYHDSAYFLTLTYDDYHVPRSYYSDPSTGEAMPSLTLCKRDWQLFMKRLRKAFPNDKLRFYMCGEYGDQTQRPHYHAIVFGLHLNDLVPFSRSVQGYQYYTSESVQRCWSARGVIRSLDGSEDCVTPLAPIGYVVVGEVTWETCAYTARYIMKKLNGPEAQFYSDFNLEKPFVLMSRKPGIARQYYDDHPDIYEYDYINLSTDKGGRKVRPPRYYDKLFDLEQPEKLAEIKLIRRRQAEALEAARLAATTLHPEEYAELQERALVSRLSSLKRKEF